MDDGGAALRHLGPPAAGLEAVGLHLAAAAEQHAVERQDGRVHMEQWQRVVEALGAFAHGPQAALGGVPVAGGEFVGVR